MSHREFGKKNSTFRKNFERKNIEGKLQKTNRSDPLISSNDKEDSNLQLFITGNHFKIFIQQYYVVSFYSKQLKR